MKHKSHMIGTTAIVGNVFRIVLYVTGMERKKDALTVIMFLNNKVNLDVP